MSPEPPLDATGIARRHFSTVRKGYDAAEVRAFLHELSDMVGRLQRGEAHERERAERAESRAELAERLDQHRLVELLGEETARVLDAAREAGTDIRTKAEESAGRLVREAQAEARSISDRAEQEAATRRREILSEADELRREAEAEVERRRGEGHVVVEAMRRDAEEDCERMLADADRARRDAESAAEQIRASARDQGRRLVGEAQAVRERILSDLARRRRTAREQLERLNGARERLLAAYEVVRRTVDEATEELTVALPEARLASEMAMRRVTEEPEETVEVLEAELSVARMTGLVDDLAAVAVSDEEFDDMLRELAEEQPEAVADEGDVVVVVAVEEPDEVGAGEDAEVGDTAVGDTTVGAADDGAAAADAEPGDETGDETADEGRSEPSVVLSVVPEPPEPEPGPAPAPGDEGETGPYVDELFARIRAERSEDESHRSPEPEGGVAVAVAPAPVAGAEKGGPDDGAEPGAEEYDPVAVTLRERDAVLAGVERELGRRLKRVLADEQNEVLDLLRRGRTVEFADVVPAPDEHADRYAIAATPDLDLAAEHGATSVGGKVLDSTDDLAGQLGRVLVDPLRVRIERSFDDCDGDLEEVTERLRSLYREWKSQHIGAAVRHYTAAAYAWGAYEATPAGAELRWLVDRSGEACPDADDNALAGDVRKGDPFPTGDRCSPAHPGCRCLVVPAHLVGGR
jgi:DivIVA domain-containing protein